MMDELTTQLNAVENNNEKKFSHRYEETKTPALNRSLSIRIVNKYLSIIYSYKYSSVRKLFLYIYLIHQSPHSL